jgi:hypothetical protein
MISLSNIKADWAYWLLGLLLSGLLLSGVFYSLSFLVKNFNVALNVSLITPEPEVKFNFEKLKQIGI